MHPSTFRTPQRHSHHSHQHQPPLPGPRAPGKPRLAAGGMSCVTPAHQTQKPPNPWAAACATGPSCPAAGPSCPAARLPVRLQEKLNSCQASGKPSAMPLPAHLGEDRGSSRGPGSPGTGVGQMRRCRAAGQDGRAAPEPRKVPPRWRLSTRDKQPNHVSSSQRKRNPRRRSFSGEGRQH